MKRKYVATALAVAVVLSMAVISKSQYTNKPKSQYQIAVDELEATLARSEDIRDLRKYVVVRSKAANLLWARDTDQSRKIFIKLWETIGKRTDDDSFDEESARIDLLEQLFPKDRSLALKLIDSVKEPNEKTGSLIDKLNGTNAETRRLAFLSYRLAEDDSVLAARVLESGLSENTAPILPLILNRIRDNNPLLANYVASQALERFPNQLPTTAVCGLATLSGYLFPLAPSPTISIEAIESDEGLRQQFMFVGYVVLKRSLSDNDESLIKVQGFNDKALTLRKINQAISAGVLSALSSRYAPEYFVELNVISNNLIQSLPKPFADLVLMQVAAVKALIGQVEKSETSDAEIIGAIAREDFHTAERLISEIKDEGKKKGWLNILFRAQARAYLKRGEPLLALSTTRKIDNSAYSIPILVEIAKVGNKKQDESLSIAAFQEIQSVASKLSKGLQAKAMFSVSSETAYLMKTQSSLLLQTSVETINGLSEIKSDQSKAVSYKGENYWNDPDSFLSSVAMIKAFAVLGGIDLQETLLIANRFRDNSLQMMARLAAIERVLRNGPPKADAENKSKERVKA